MLVKKQRRLLEIRVEMSQFYKSVIAIRPRYRLLSPHAAELAFAYRGSNYCCVGGFHQQDERTSCNCWGPKNCMGAINQLWNSNRYTELTLSGRKPVKAIRETHPLMTAAAFRGVEPETFKVELDTTLWDVTILERMSVVNLKNLELPISQPSDCVRLGRALAQMARLVCLAIMDIPDEHDFVSQLGHIGAGILKCASTLRELDIEITDCFRKREVDGFIFRQLFPCERSRLEPGSEDEAPLRLTKLRCKCLNLPWYSFDRIFDATTIKNIHLSRSMVDGRVWEVLEARAQLDTLTEIDHDMLSADSFLRLLSQQSSLKRTYRCAPTG